MLKYIKEKLSKIFIREVIKEVEVTPIHLREQFFDYTWLQALQEILFFTGEKFEDFNAYTSDVDLDYDIANILNFVAYTDNFIYYAHNDNTDDEEEISGFKLIPLSQKGYDFLEGKDKPTIH